MHNFWQKHILMCKEGNELGGLCGLLYRSVYQDFDLFSLIPIRGTILIFQLLDFLLELTKKDNKD